MVFRFIFSFHSLVILYSFLFRPVFLTDSYASAVCLILSIRLLTLSRLMEITRAGIIIATAPREISIPSLTPGQM